MSGSDLAGLAAREQPQPRPGGRPVTPWLLGWLASVEAPLEVVEAVRARDALGRVRYGQPLTTVDGRDPVADLAQELADALLYAARLRMTGDQEGIESTRALLDTLNRLVD